MSSPEKRRKIAIIGPYPPFRGGIAHFSEQFHKALAADSSIDVVGVSFSRQYPKLLFPGKTQYADGGGLDVAAHPLIDSINPFSWKKTATWLVREQVDEVVFMYWMPFFAPAYMRIASRLKALGIKTTAVVHNAKPHEKQPFGALLTRRFLSGCDRIIALSGTVERDVLSLGVKIGTKMLAHPVYSHFGDRLEKRDARRKLGLHEKGPVLLFFGLIRRYKGLDVLIEAMSKTSTKATLVVAGEWYEEKAEHLKQIELFKLGDRIDCRDAYIPDDDVGLYFSAADVVVQPYRNATQSGVVQIAFHFGLPSIVTGVGGLPEMVNHGVDGLVVAPENPDALAKAIDHYFSDGIESQLQLGAAQKKDTVTWDAFVSGFLA